MNVTLRVPPFGKIAYYGPGLAWCTKGAEPSGSIEHKNFTLEVKSVGADGTFDGYAAVFNNVDSDNDRIVPGAFADSLKAKGEGCPILWQHSTFEPIGVNKSAIEDGNGLAVKGQLVLEVQRGAEGYALLKARAIKGLSIGYRVLDYAYEGGVRLLKKLDLMEYSLVTFPANILAEVTSVKGVIPFQALPLASSDHGYDVSAARGRIVKWAGGSENPDWSKLRKCYLWMDSDNPEEISSYKIPIVDIVNDRPIVIPKAVKMAADQLNGESKSIPEEASEACKAHLLRYFRKMGDENPFEKKRVKRVDGVDLPAHCFAYLGDPDKSDTWRLPIECPADESKSKSLVGDALARFDQTEGIPASERATVLDKIKAAAKKHGIDTTKTLDPAEVTTAAGEPVTGELLVKDFNETLAAREAMRTHLSKLNSIQGAHGEAMKACYQHATMTPDQKKAQITKNMEQYSKAMTDWHHNNVDLGAKDGYDSSSVGYMADATPVEGKSGRTISKTTAAKLKAAHDLIEAGIESIKSGGLMVKEMGSAPVVANEDLGFTRDTSQNNGNADVVAGERSVGDPDPTGEGITKGDLGDIFAKHAKGVGTDK